MTNTSKIMKCGHCGKKTLFHLRAEGTLAGTTLNGLIRDHYDGGIITTWRVLECGSCLKPTLQEEKVDYSLELEPGSSEIYVMEAIPGNASEVILYPGKIPLTDLPKVIEKRYLTALEVQDINPNAFAVLIGSVLEAVCNNEKIPGKNLREKIDNLVQSDRIPKPLAEMAHQLRQIRNLGAHDTDNDVTKEDVPIIRDFVDAILEFLYIAPAKIAAIQARLKKTP